MQGEAFAPHFFARPAAPGSLGVTLFATEMVASKSRKELWMSVHDISPVDRLPIQKARLRIVIHDVLNAGQAEAAMDAALEAYKEQHLLQGANPVAINLIPKAEPRVSKNLCTCCGGPSMNGPHVDPAVRAVIWDTVGLKPRPPPPRPMDAANMLAMLMAGVDVGGGGGRGGAPRRRGGGGGRR